MLEADIGSVTLALQTLGSFNFGGKQSVLHSLTHSSLTPLSPPPPANPPLQLVQNCAEHYLTSEHRSVRMEAVRTCAALLVPSLLPPSIFTTPFVQFSQASAQVHVISEC